MFGDIVTDLGAQLQGGLGMAASGNINPGATSMFEPVHGSAPKYAGSDRANPFAAILTAAMMLDHTGLQDAAQRVESGPSSTVWRPARRPWTSADGSVRRRRARRSPIVSRRTAERRRDEEACRGRNVTAGRSVPDTHVSAGTSERARSLSTSSPHPVDGDGSLAEFLDGSERRACRPRAAWAGSRGRPRLETAEDRSTGRWARIRSRSGWRRC